MDRYESFPQFVKPIQNIRVSPLLMNIDIQRQDRHIVFETVTTPCQTPKTNENLRTVTHTHIQTTPRTTALPDSLPKRIKICKPSPLVRTLIPKAIWGKAEILGLGHGPTNCPHQK